MITGSVKLSGDWNALKRADLSFGRANMQELAEFALDTLKDRVAHGVGSDDTPMPPLKTIGRGRNGRPVRIPWTQQKSRLGLQPIRNLYGTGKTGHMLDDLQVRSVTSSSAQIGFSRQSAIAKAAVNEARSAWLWFSDSDQKAIIDYARALHIAQIEALRRQLAGSR